MRSLYCSAAGTLILSFINNVTLPTLFLSVHIMYLRVGFSFCSRNDYCIFLTVINVSCYIKPLDAVPLTFPGPGENTADVWSSYEDIRTGSRSAVRWNRWGSGDAAAAALVNTDSLLQRRWSGGRGAAIRGVKGSAKLQTLAESWLFRWERGESNAVMASLPQGGRRRKKETTLMHLRSSD